VRVERIVLRDFRTYERADVEVGPGLTIVHGANGSGKTNLLEGLYFGATARSFRTTNERELVRFGAPALRVELAGADADGHHELAVGFAPGEPKRMTSDGAPIERMLDAPHRPLVAVFSPDRLELVKGPAALRRAHLDQFVVALWPTRAATRAGYREALAQRNAQLLRVRGGRSPAESLAPWTQTLALAGVSLAADRRAAVARVAEVFVEHAGELGLSGTVTVSYRERVPTGDAAELGAAITDALEADLARGHTTRGPHRDDLEFARDGRTLRRYGSQGEQRLALLALLLAERDAIAAERDRPPLLLLDDVMSELDAARRARLVARLRAGGQVIVSATEREHVPGWDSEGVALVGVP